MAGKSIAIIPARGGSKRIPGKNIKPFNGRPIIAYSIEAALKSGCFDEVMVSTDDGEIAEVAGEYGAVVPFVRSSANSDDHATLAQVCKEVLEQYKDDGIVFDLFCCILPTAPFVSAANLQKGKQILLESAADSVVTVAKFSYPAQRALKLDEKGTMSMIWPEFYESRSQDLPPAYHDAGQFYWMRSKSLLDQMRFFAANSIALPLSEMEAQDIDTLDDWQLAELKYKQAMPAAPKRQPGK